jgi:hypothetical protein
VSSPLEISDMAKRLSGVIGLEALPHLKGQAYDDVYTSLFYLNERMGTFAKKKQDDRLC